MSVSIKNFTRQRSPRLPFAAAAEAALPGWDISLAFAGETRALRLNKQLRDKTYVPNVLSYEVSDRSSSRRTGEIVICPAVAAKQAGEFGLSTRDFIFLLFIHGCLHLKGARHGVTMERRERALMARLLPTYRSARTTTTSSLTNGPTHRNRHRYRHLPGEAGRRRRSH